MKKTKSNLDELQELKLLKIEHNGCWLAFWGLLAVILTQIAIGNDSKQDLSGEWIVFMCLAAYLTIGCLTLPIAKARGFLLLPLLHW